MLLSNLSIIDFKEKRKIILDTTDSFTIIVPDSPTTTQENHMENIKFEVTNKATGAVRIIEALYKSQVTRLLAQEIYTVKVVKNETQTEDKAV